MTFRQENRFHLAVLWSLLFLFLVPAILFSQELPEEFRLQNPMSVDYLNENLRSEKPRLVLTGEISSKLQEDVASDATAGAYYEILKSDAARILEEPLLEHEIYDGKRLLAISREMVHRFGILGMVYHLGKDPDILERIGRELMNVSRFPDWNPSHFLDTGEMALGVALALDWAGDDLPQSTVEMAKQALIEKGIEPSFEGNRGWIRGVNNWNQVCHGGMVAAAIAVAEDEPELAAKTLSRALEGMPYALKEYAPDGIYPEGPTYWDYGTMYSVITASMFQSAFGTDFGLSDSPGFLESARFRMLVVGSTGEFFNFFDAGSNMRSGGSPSNAWFNRGNGTVNLTWFAARTGNPLYFDSSYYTDVSENRRRSRFDGPAMVWLSQYEPGEFEPLPLNWSGQGKNPLAIFRGENNDRQIDPESMYLGTKGGRGSLPHGHLDAGSFVFDLDGVRWSIDQGMQSYAPIEQTGFDLWGRSQDADRWTLQAYNNFGHSTLTVNDELHNVDGHASLIHFDDGSDGGMPEATYDMTEIFEPDLRSATRRFVKEDTRSIRVEDHFEISDTSEWITWQLITEADVTGVPGGAVLRQDGKALMLEILEPEGLEISIVSMNPPPMELDKRTENLKRIEVRAPTWIFQDGKGKISVRLAGR